jgi:hypothetical protein
MIVDAASSTRLPAGAGRTVDVSWPDWLNVVSTAGVPNTFRGRLGQAVGTGAMAIGGYNGGSAVIQVSNSATHGCMICTVGAGASDGIGQIVRYNLPGPQIFMVQTKGHAMNPGSDTIACSRVLVNAAYTGIVINTVDSGLQCTYGGAGMVGAGGPAVGVGFFRAPGAVMRATCLKTSGGALNNLAVTGAGTLLPAFNDLILNTYELRFVSATQGAEAFIQWVINGVVVRTLFYGAGTILPETKDSVSSCFTAALFNGIANTTMQVKNFDVKTGPTLLDTF